MEYRLRAMELWFQHLPGSLLMEMEAAVLSRWLSAVSGQHLVQIGGPSDLRLVKSAHVSHKSYLSTQFVTSTHSARIQSNLNALPLLPGSVDLVVLDHLLEYAESPALLLHEIYTALVPNGQLLLMVFNPWSLWGWTRRMRGRRGFPWSGQFYAYWKIKRWLKKAGYSIIYTKTLCYRPTVYEPRQAKRWRWIDLFAGVFLPGFGAARFIAVQKKEVGMTPVKAKVWGRRVKMGRQVVEPTSRMRVKNQ